MAKLNLNDLSTGTITSLVNQININNLAIETALENTLSRDGISPNVMMSDLDMNSNQILNLPTPIAATDVVRLVDLQNFASSGGSASVGPILSLDKLILGSTVYNQTTTAVVPNGSVGEGTFYSVSNRVGGFGQYGNVLCNYTITDAIPSGEFDCGLTSWASARSLTGGTVFGGWSGANTPNSELSQTYTSGAAVGFEVNVGNRWGDLGFQTDIGGTRYTVGIQIAPDVIPATGEAAPVAINHGNFGFVTAASVNGHKWYVGNFTRTNAIAPNGNAFRIGGGSTVPNAPASVATVTGNWVAGIDMSTSVFSGNAFSSPGFSVAPFGTVTAAGLALPLNSGIGWNSSDVLITHATNTLTFSGASIGYMFLNGPMGVGTSTPAATFAVAGTNSNPSLIADTGNVLNLQSNTSVQLAGSAINSGSNSFWLQVKQSTNSGNSFPLCLNPIGGNVGVGTLAPARKLHVEIDDATTNAVTMPLRITHTTSGTPALGIGVGLEFEAETAAATNKIGASISAITTDVTAASEDFDLVFRQMIAGAAAAETFRFVNTGALNINSVKVLGTRRTGWTLPTGTSTRTGFVTSTVTLPQLAEAVKALIEDLHGTAGHGLIGV